jgi:hypothetical protein
MINWRAPDPAIDPPPETGVTRTKEGRLLMICPKCNLASADNARFCAHCGEPFGTGSGNPPATPSSAPNVGTSASAAGTAAWASATSRLPGIIERIKNILLTPKTEWRVIEPEPTSIAQLYTGYVMPLTGLSALMSFVHMSVIGVSMPFGGAFRTPLLSGLLMALASFGFGLLGLFLVGLIINALAPTFAGQRYQRQAMKTAAYAFTPAYVASVLALLGGFGTLLQLIACIYGIYLLYLGLPLLMKSPSEKATGYTVTVVICTILLGILLGVLSAAMGGFGGYGRLPSAALTREEQQQQAAAAAGNVIGGMLGTDQKGKEGLGAAINNLAEAGRKMQQQQSAGAAATTPAATSGASGTGADAGNPQQNAVAATAGMLTALGGAMGGSRHIDPVDFHTLKDLLPSALPGLQRADAQGSSQQALGVKGSSASADYQGQSGERAVMKISDMSGVSGLLDLATAVAQTTSSESDAGFERDATVAGRTVHEKYDNKSRHGEISAIVAKRFVVEVTGDGMEMASLEQDIGAVDFARLEAMKDAGVRPN